MDLADLIRNAMKEKGVHTQAALAQALAVNQSTVARWLKGDGGPGDEVAPRLADFLGAEVGEVLHLAQEARTNRRADSASRARLKRVLRGEGDQDDEQAVELGLLRGHIADLRTRVALLEQRVGDLDGEQAPAEEDLPAVAIGAVVLDDGTVLDLQDHALAASEPGADPFPTPTDEADRPRPPAVDPDDVS